MYSEADFPWIEKLVWRVGSDPLDTAGVHSGAQTRTQQLVLRRLHSAGDANGPRTRPTTGGGEADRNERTVHVDLRLPP